MSIDSESGTATASTAGTGAPITTTPGRWLHGWNAEDTAQWASRGRAIAKRNLAWSIACEFLGFVVWQLWSIVVVFLPGAGFTFSSSELFWLISIPSLVGATLLIHPLAAAARGIDDGGPVTIANARGTVRCTARHNTTVRIDTVFLPFHFGREANANLLTSAAVDPISGMPEFKATSVTVTADPATVGTSDIAFKEAS